MTLSVRAGLVVVRAYQLVLGPFFGGACRFEPSCSEYATQALCQHGFWRGMALALKRVAHCHPLGSAGFDPVPPRRPASGSR